MVSTNLSYTAVGKYIFVVVDVVVVVPSSVSTSEAQHPRRSSRHPYFRPHPGLIPHRRLTPTGGGHQIVGGLPSEGDTALLPSHFGGVQ